MQQIEETERLIAVYRDANEVIIGTQDEVCSRRGLINRTTLTAAEIGQQIVRILERRLAAMRTELQKLGAEYQGETDDRPMRPWHEPGTSSALPATRASPPKVRFTTESSLVGAGFEPLGDADNFR